MPPSLPRPSQIAGVPLAHNLPAVLKLDNTETGVTNSVTQTTILTETVPAGEIGANDCLYITCYISILNNSGAGQTYTFQFSFGGSTVTVTATAVAASATTFGCVITLMIKNLGVTNSQKAVASLIANGIVTSTGHNNWAVDTTLAQTLLLKVTCSSATATQTVTQLLAELVYGKQT